MVIEYVIWFKKSHCNCFSLNDLLVNIKFAQKEKMKIVSVESQKGETNRD